MTDPDRVRPWHHSETLLRGFGGQPPFKFCGGSTDCHGTGMATLLESDTAPDGRLIDRATRVARLKRGWRGFTKVADTNGIPDTGDLLRIHAAMYPNLPAPDQFNTRDFDDVVDRVDAGFAVSIALRLSALGSSNDIDFTTADHQTLFWGRKGDEVWTQGPMRPHSDRYDGHRAPLRQFRIAAKAIESGLVLTWLYPIGGWTAAALQTEALRDRLRDERDKVESLTTQVDNKEAKVVELRARVAELEAAGTDCGPIVERKVDAALESERIAIRDLVDARRSL
jgi:hypothetical protein